MRIHAALRHHETGTGAGHHGFLVRGDEAVPEEGETQQSKTLRYFQAFGNDFGKFRGIRGHDQNGLRHRCPDGCDGRHYWFGGRKPD